MLRSLILIKSISTNKVKQKGAAFIEFILVFGLIILPITIATLNIGKLLWQTQTLSDIARESARVATIQSDRDPTLTCQQITTFAESTAWQTLQSNQSWQLSNTWAPMVYLSPTRIFRANNSALGAPEARIRMINVIYATNPNNSCLFCGGDILQRLNIWVYSAMDINSNSICAQS